MPHPSAAAPGTFHSLEREFRALAAAFVPEAAALDESGWRSLEAEIDEALAARPPALARQLRLFVRALGWLALARYGRRLAALDARRRERVLRWVERSRLLALRRGFWGLRTLVFLAYWARPEAGASIGYRARAEGWAARR